jgi:hypothetical protein
MNVESPHSAEDPERILAFDFIRATENAALRAHPWLGWGDKNKADFAGSDAICRGLDGGHVMLTDSRTASVILTGGYETARMFQVWRTSMPLCAETSGTITPHSIRIALAGRPIRVGAPMSVLCDPPFQVALPS